MSYADVNGQRIYYEDSGGSGPPVILAHGFLMDHEMFAPQVAALAPEFRVITWDERGFGLTEFDGKPFTYWDSASDCLGLLTHLGIDEAVVGGMSQGGFLSMRAALTSPERVKALVLLDTQSGNDPDEVLEGLPRDAADVADRRTSGRARRPDRRPDHRRSRREPEVDREVEGEAEGALPRAVEHIVRARRHHRPRRRDHLPGVHRARHCRHRDHARVREGAPRRRFPTAWRSSKWRAVRTPRTSPIPTR